MFGVRDILAPCCRQALPKSLLHTFCCCRWFNPSACVSDGVPANASALNIPDYKTAQCSEQATFAAIAASAMPKQEPLNAGQSASCFFRGCFVYMSI